MRYAEARLTPESQVTQTTPLERRANERLRARGQGMITRSPALGPRFADQHDAGKAADKALAFVNRDREAKDVMYQKGVNRGGVKGFIYGLVTGALAVAVLAAVVLGDVLEHF